MRHLCLPHAVLLVLVLLATGSVPAPATAADEMPEIAGAAKAALEAHGKRDQATLLKIAESGEIDPWIVAHDLCLRGELRAARSLASASKRRDLSPLKRYIGDLARRRPPPIASWLARAKCVAFAKAEKWFDLVKLIKASPPDLTGRDLAAVDQTRMHAYALAQLDRHEEAAQAYWTAGQAAEKIGWWQAASSSYDACAESANVTRDFLRMIECKRQSFTIYGRVGMRELAANMLADLGTVHAQLADYPQAIEHFQPVLEEYDDALATSSKIIIQVNLGLAFLKMGQYAECELALHRARTAALDPRFAKPHPELSGDLHTYAKSILGMLRTELGEFDDADRLLKSVLKFQEAKKDVRGQADTQGAFAELAEAQGDFDDAIERYESSLDLFEEAEHRAGAARARLGIAAVLRKQGKLKKATRELKKIIAEQEDLNDAEALCMVHAELSLAYRSQGDEQRALAHREENLQLAREAASVKLEAQALAEMARLCLDRKDYKLGLNYAEQAEGIIGLIFDRLAPGQAARAREIVAQVYDVGLESAVRWLEAAAEEKERATRQGRVFFWMEGGRAGALLVALEGRASIREVAIDEKLQVIEDEARTHEAIARQKYLDAKGNERRPAVRAAKVKLDTARQNLKAAIERIQLEAGMAADLLYPSAKEMGDIRALLKDEEALVLYGSYGESKRTTVAFVLRKNGPPRVQELGDEGKIGETCLAVRTAMIEKTEHSAAKTLREQVVAPLGLKTDVKRILFSPAGALAYQPPALLFPDHEVACVPSGSAYARLIDAPKSVDGEVLAIANPTYGKAPPGWRGGTAVNRVGLFEPLPETEKEAKNIATHRLLGDKATEEGLKQEIARLSKDKQRLRALHIACHGLVDDERPGRSALALTATTKDNGLLTVLDISQLQIPADLVVLSACESGLGRNFRAEGISSLSRSFMVAGAPRVMVSLWKVEDAATRALMTKFYELWNAKDKTKRVSATVALRQAQAHVKNQPKWAHPKYWAAWQLWGPPH